MSNAQAILGAGAIRLDLYNYATQTWGGLGEPLGADRFAITPQSEVREKMSKRSDTYGQAIASVVIPQPTQLAITISAMDKEALAMQFQGLLATYTQAAGSVTGEVIVARLDKWVRLSRRNLASSGLVVKSNDGETTYVINDDYVVDYARGEIKVLTAGDVAAGATLKVDFTSQALSGDRVRGGVQPQVRVRGLFEGVNMVDQSPLRVEFYEGVLRSTNEFDFLADDFNGIELEGTLVVPAGKTEAYIVDLDAVGI